jgi:alpha-tubulin suppressor-like RCC1 family protein
MEDGSLYTTGLNAGQLGLGDNNNRTTFTQVTNLPSGTIKQVVCGYNNSFILLEDNSIYITGHNGYGQLGLGDNGAGTNRNIFTKVTNIPSGTIKQIECGGGHSFILFEDNSIYTCGHNTNGQLGLGDSGDNTNRNIFTKVTNLPSGTIKQVVCGYNISFILLEDNSIYATGYNSYGQLGLGDKTTRTTFTQVTNLPSGNIKQLVSGWHQSFILLEDDRLYGAGSNQYGQLGLGDTTQISSFTQILNIF